MKRRIFLTELPLAGAGLALSGDARARSSGPMFSIEDPFDGAVLNRHHGRVENGQLHITVRGTARPDQAVTVNGLPATRDGHAFRCEIPLSQPETGIVAKAGEISDAIRVRWDRNSFPRYRFAIDDNSFFLRDIAEKQYKSLFDCFYLGILRDLHRKYGAKFALNIYYTTADWFDLTKFPDRYKSEWADNADWLKLAFHAHANDPPRPYQDAPPEQVVADFRKVREQILRFAGEDTYSPTTIIHFGMVRPTAYQPLAKEGIGALSGYFSQRNGKWDINYRLDDVRSEYLSRHDALVDWKSGIVFSRIDIVCNTVPLEKIVPHLEEVAADPNTAEIMDLMTHEQYFWPFYKRYLPDHAQRLDAAIRFVTERGYKPVFLHEGFLGAPV